MPTSFNSADFQKECGLLLRLHRKKAGLSQTMLADLMEVKRPTIANLELGRQRFPMDIAWRAAVILKISLSQLAP